MTDHEHSAGSARRGIPSFTLSEDGTPAVSYRPLGRIAGPKVAAVPKVSRGLQPEVALEGPAALKAEAALQLEADLGSEAAPAESLFQFSISYFATSAQVAAKLQLGSVFSTNVSASSMAIFYDAVATTDFQEGTKDTDGTILYELRHGIGVRLAVRADNLSASIDLSYAAIAAQAKYSRASIYYEVQGLGITQDLIKGMLKGVPTVGELNEDSYARIDTLLRVSLPDYLASDAPLAWTEYAVAPRAAGTEAVLNTARAVDFAMTQISRGKSLSSALTTFRSRSDFAELDAFLVEYVYARYAGITDPTSSLTPNREALDSARAWLTVLGA